MARYEPFERGRLAYERVIGTVPDGLARPSAEEVTDAALSLTRAAWNRWSTPVRRYLAARAFGSWAAYEARGVRTIVAELFLANTVLQIETARALQARRGEIDADTLRDAVRASDWLLIHLADRTALMKWWGEVEGNL
jgi:hypothetical protein